MNNCILKLFIWVLLFKNIYLKLFYVQKYVKQVFKMKI
jgi:hypothetical protein